MMSYRRLFMLLIALTILACTKTPLSRNAVALFDARNIVGTYVGQIKVTSAGEYYNDSTHLWQSYSGVDTVYNDTLVISNSADTGFVVDKWPFVIRYDSASNYQVSFVSGYYSSIYNVKYIYAADSLYEDHENYQRVSAGGEGSGGETAFAGKKIK